MIKERLDRFLVSRDAIEDVPFFTTKVIRQTKSDHDAILLDSMGE